MELFSKVFSTASAANRHEVIVEDFSTITLVMVNGNPAGSGITGVFEASPDAVNKESGVWVPVVGQRSNNQSTFDAGFTSQAISALNYGWTFNVAGYKRFRFRQTAISTGGYTALIAASKVPTTFVPPNTVSLTGSLPGVLGSPASGTMTKFEDAAAASGDTGIAIFGARVPATPAAQTSAAGDYGTLAITSDGKQVPAGQGAEEHTWQTWTTAPTTVADLKALAGATLQNYVTDVAIENTAASKIRVSFYNTAGATLFAVTVPAGTTWEHSFKTPIKSGINSAIRAAADVVGANVLLTGYIGV